MLVQPMALQDTIPCFRAIHKDMKSAYHADVYPNKVFTDIDFFLRTLYTEAVMEEKNILIVHDTISEVAVVVVNLTTNKVSAEVYEKSFTSEDEEIAFQLFIGFCVLKKITEEDCIWNDTSCKLGLALL